MSRSKKEWNDTESMLTRLQDLLWLHNATGRSNAEVRADAESLRRISMTLHRWHELECNADVQRYIPKTIDGKRVYIVAEESGFPYMVNHDAKPMRYTRIPDRERGALKRLASIMKRYPTLQSYIQGDPRGCALYILKPGNVPEGQDVSAYYSRGLAVFK